MEARQLLEALHVAERLKDETRHCTTTKGAPENVASHSWRMALMAYFMTDEFPELDMNKVIKMCLIHDLGECFTGDIPTFRKTQADEDREASLLSNWVRSLPDPYCVGHDGALRGDGRTGDRRKQSSISRSISSRR